MSSPPPIVLTFAGSDPTGGAGLQADLLTLASMGCHPLSVVTALTVQDTHGVVSLDAVDAARVRMQAERVLGDTRVAAIKLGLLGSAANVQAVAAILAEHAEIPVVLDPVLASGRGDALATEDAIAALRELIVPQSTVVTPNSIEALRLANASSLAQSAQRLVERGAEYVLVIDGEIRRQNQRDIVVVGYDFGDRTHHLRARCRAHFKCGDRHVFEQHARLGRDNLRVEPVDFVAARRVAHRVAGQH